MDVQVKTSLCNSKPEASRSTISLSISSWSRQDNAAQRMLKVNHRFADVTKSSAFLTTWIS